MAGAGITPASDDPPNQLVISIRSKFAGLSPPSDCCIFTVPEWLRQSNEEAYTPRVVAIGPYHRLNPSLMPMEDHKLRYLENFLQDNQNCNLEDYVEQVLLMHSGYQMTLPRDRIFGKPWMLSDVRRDMTLLENQMPFFVIQRLFIMARGTHEDCTPGLLLELVDEFFNPITKMERFPGSLMWSEVKHLVDAIRHFLLLSVMAPDNGNEGIKFAPSAMELVAAGVKLRRGESKCLLDIEFEKGAQNPVSHRYLTDYMAFMDGLVDTPSDAELLINKGIIENWLSNKEDAANLINTFGKEIEICDDYYFCSLSDKLIKHCQSPCNKWKATLKHDHCRNPWVVISVIAAAVLLLLTVAQTVCSILSLI
ncbi:hypothetical protein NL676_035242 [Syzygium grande]|nr:hypothetical protein NL676_035242 [Syzygium grande]